MTLSGDFQSASAAGRRACATATCNVHHAAPLTLAMLCGQDEMVYKLSALQSLRTVEYERVLGPCGFEKEGCWMLSLGKAGVHADSQIRRLSMASIKFYMKSGPEYNARPRNMMLLDSIAGPRCPMAPLEGLAQHALTRRQAPWVHSKLFRGREPALLSRTAGSSLAAGLGLRVCELKPTPKPYVSRSS